MLNGDFDTGVAKTRSLRRGFFSKNATSFGLHIYAPILSYCQISARMYRWRMIPRIIHRIWVDPGGQLQAPDLPAEIRRNLQSWATHESGCTQKLWSLAELLRLCQIHDMPEVGRALEACRFPSMKADIGRFLVLKLFGGFWADLKLALKRPFLQQFSDHDLVTTEHYPKEDFPEPNGHLTIQFIGATQDHPVINETLRLIAANVNSRKPGSIYHVTGATNFNTAVSQAANLRHDHMIPHQAAWQDLFALEGVRSYTAPTMHWSEREQRESPYLDG